MSAVDRVLVHAGLVLFAVATALGLRGARSGSSASIVQARLASLGGALLLAIMLVRHGAVEGQFPVASRFETQIAVAALLAILSIAIDLLQRLPVLTIGAAPMCCLAVLVAVGVGAPATGDQPPASPWVGAHVALTLIAYGLFSVSFVSGVLYLIEERMLKSGAGAAGVLGVMPSIETSYRMLVRTLGLGVAFLTIGTVIGYLFGRKAGLPAGWRTDPKIILTTAAWAAYIAVLGVSLLPRFRGRRTAIASALAFVFLMACLWAAAFWSGFHRFA